MGWVPSQAGEVTTTGTGLSQEIWKIIHKVKVGWKRPISLSHNLLPRIFQYVTFMKDTSCSMQIVQVV